MRAGCAPRLRSLFKLTLKGNSKREISTSVRAPIILPADALVDEETTAGYDPDDFYYASPGEVLDGRYELKAKIGWGTSSTVRRWESSLSVAIKINASKYNSQEDAQHELNVSDHMANSPADHRGRDILRIPYESFEIIGSASTHVCLVFEPMREPLWLFTRRFGSNKVTREWLPLFKVYLRTILEGLHYLHSTCHLDISVIEKFIRGQVSNPMARKLLPNGRTVYRCHNELGDFGLAQRADKPHPCIFSVQPDYCQAPRVLFGTGWSYPADIWNFGIMVHELLANESLFRTKRQERGPYSARVHFANIWSPETRNYQGRMCNNAADYYAGPFLAEDGIDAFGKTGSFNFPQLIPSQQSLADVLPECIPDDEKEVYLDLMKKMLSWLPEDRPTAIELEAHPWLNS
ncbi:kinase-like protein [Aulographum hederae CBS 113979]|uniref:Kinase-like protein n=1 Tax=Aulographum hederae CBS 113979 TaxID=1176131 RepID=A0A6G1GNM0_9PEZI|nr:kinase-like protein [Aulographum hederae CBS 113979]